MPRHGANTIMAVDRISKRLANQGYNVKVSKPRNAKTKYVVTTEGRKKKKGRGRIWATFKSSVI